MDVGAVIGRVQAIVDRGADGARSYLESLPGVRLVMGEARFEEPGVVTVAGERLRAPRVVIAAGAAPRPLPVPGLEETGYLTSDDVLTLRELPGRLLVVGAGPIGLELGQALGRLGSRVTMVEVTERLLPRGGAGGRRDARRAAGRGGHRAAARRRHRAGRAAPGRRPAPGRGARRRARGELDGDAILLGAGRGPSVERLRLEAAGVEGSREGHPGGRAPAHVAGRPLRRRRHPGPAVRRVHADRAAAGAGGGRQRPRPRPPRRQPRRRPDGHLHRPGARDHRASPRSRRARPATTSASRPPGSRAARRGPGARSAAWSRRWSTARRGASWAPTSSPTTPPT